MPVQRLKQNSPQWHKARAKEGLCLASQAPAVMSAGKFKPRNQDELLQYKRGELKIAYTRAMAHGNQYEAEARAWAEEYFDTALEPISVTNQIDGLEFWASLDGADMDLNVSVEIKCPLRGKDSVLWAYVEQNQSPPLYYYWQMVHQWMTSGAENNYFIVYDAENKSALYVAVHFMDVDARVLHRGWRTFWERYYSGEQVPTASSERADSDWQLAADRWRTAKAGLAGAQKAEKLAREALIALAGDSNYHGAGVRVSRYEAKGQIDYGNIPALAGVDLEQYRKESGYRWRIELNRRGHD